MLKCWSRPILIGSLSFTHQNPNVFITSQWQSKSTPNLYYLIYRISITLYLIITWLLTIIDEQHFGMPIAFYIKWLVYLTNWGFTMVVLQASLSTIMLSNAFALSRQQEWSEDGPVDNALVTKLYKLYWIVFTIAMGTSTSISALYWTLVYNADVEIDYLNVMGHVMNAIVMLIELCVVAHPVRFMHFYVLVTFGMVYGFFTFLYFLAGGTSRLDEPYVYRVLDWNHPGNATVVVIGACVLVSVIHALSFLLKKLLLLLANRIVKGKDNEHATGEERFAGLDNDFAVAH